MGEEGPLVIRHAIPLFGDYERTRLCIVQLVRMGRLVELGDVQLKEWGGKKEKVFGAPSLRIKRDWLQHDTMLFEYLRLLPDAQIVTGYNCNPKTRSDAEVTFSNGRFAHVEMDRGTESLRDCERRWDVLAAERRQAFSEGQEWVLFLTVSAHRIALLKTRAARHAIAPAILFGLWYEVVKDHAGDVWQDIDGDRVAVCDIRG